MKKEKLRQTVLAAARVLGTVLGVFLLLTLLVKGCNYLVVDDANSYTRLTLHEFYESEEEIQTLFLGTSHCFRAYDPQSYEALTGECAYNLGSSAQNLDASYYLLKEALKYQEIRKVYLDLYHVFFFFHTDNRELVESNIISDYMRPSLNKMEFILRRSSQEHYTNSIFAFRRDWQKLGDFAYLKENLSKKSRESYQNYEPVVYEDERYVGKGFVASEAVLDPLIYDWTPKSDPVDLSGDDQFALTYLEKLVHLCEQEQIELVFLTAPSYEKHLEAMDSYEEAHAYVASVAESFGIEYIDFNTDVELTLGLEDFMDADHLNGIGAEKVTGCLAELVNQKE